MEIICNNKPRHIIYGFELTESEKKEFDYVDDVNDGSFFRYKGRVYDLGEFMRITPSTAPHPQRNGWEKFHGHMSDTYFSGLLIRLSDDGESVIVGRYSC